jgi:hypothetical protein
VGRTMTKTKKTKAPAIKFDAYPLIGYEYSYLGQPVRVTRVVPTAGHHITPGDAHVEFVTRWEDGSTCDASELTLWQDVTKPLTKQQATRIMLAIQDAIEDALSDGERELAKWQLKRLKGL